MRIAFIMLLTAFFSTASAAPVGKAEEKKVLSAMDDLLFDSESARLKDVGVFKAKDGGNIVCGQVNAKNRYGAYVGYTPFMGIKLDSGDYLIIGISEAAGAVCEKQKVQ